MPPTLATMWPLRIVWLLAPFLAGPAIAAALDLASGPVQTTAAVIAWGGWAAAFAVMLVPRTLSLTLLRVAVPAGLAAAAWATVVRGAPVRGTAALVWGVAAVALLLRPATADAFVDGSSYGPERRFLLRTPGPLLLGPAELAWAAVVAGAITGPLLLAAKLWALGALVLVAGWFVAYRAGRSLHALSRRWIVFVPAGLVVHDHVLLADPLLFRRQDVGTLAPAAAGTEALDVTGGALGLAVELRLRAPGPVGLRRGGRRGTVHDVTTDALLFTPGRPGSLLAEAESRRIPVG